MPTHTQMAAHVRYTFRCCSSNLFNDPDYVYGDYVITYLYTTMNIIVSYHSMSGGVYCTGMTKHMTSCTLKRQVCFYTSDARANRQQGFNAWCGSRRNRRSMTPSGALVAVPGEGLNEGFSWERMEQIADVLMDVVES